MLTTDRLVLRELGPGDAPFVRALMNDPSFIAHIGDRGVRTIDDAQRYIERGPWTRYSTRGFGLYVVQLREPAVPIGVCGLLKRDELPGPDIGFAFLPAFWSKGYAFESARAVMRFASSVLQLHEIFAIVNVSNAASIRLLEKLGFVFARTMQVAEHAPPAALYVAALVRGTSCGEDSLVDRS